MTMTQDHPHDLNRGGLGTPTVLLVDGDADQADRLRGQLAVHGANAIVCPDGAEALMTASTYRPDLILLGRDVPLIGGATFLRVLRRRHQTPVVVGVDRESAQDVATLLAAGATACVAWPFGVADVVRMLPAPRTTEDRLPPTQQEGQVAAGDLRIDIAGHDVYLGTERLRLPLREFQLLVLLASNADRVLPKDLIIETLWGRLMDGTRTRWRCTSGD